MDYVCNNGHVLIEDFFCLFFCVMLFYGFVPSLYFVVKICLFFVLWVEHWPENSTTAPA